MNNNLKNENIENIIKEKKELLKLYKIKDNLKTKTNETWYQMNDKEITFDEYKTIIDETEKQEKNIKNKIELQEIKVAILQNNITTNVIQIFKNSIFEQLKKYSNKNIGEARKKEIETIIEDTLEKYGIIASCYFCMSQYSFELCTFSISVYEKYGTQWNEWRKCNYKAFENELVKKIEISISKEQTENGEIKKEARYPQQQRIVENYKEYSKQLQNKHNRALAKIKKLQNEIDTIRSENNEAIYNNLYDILYINLK